MVNGHLEKSSTRTPARIEFGYTFGKLNEAVDKCDNSALEWGAASTRSNEIGLCRKEITESEYNDQRQKISGMIASFSYNCKCSSIIHQAHQ